MPIDVTLLTTVAECDTAIDILEAEKTLLERRKRNLGEALDGRADTSNEVAQGLQSVQAVIAGYQAALAVITDEREQMNLELKVEREETKLKSLQNRQARYNAVAVLEDQVDEEQLAVQIPVLQNTIAQIQAHKLTL
ncbi:MAG: hypothetical protein ACFB10_16640 [Salibacteraceae bacterium]